MRSIVLIAYNTFKETVRNKVLYTILFFAGIIIVLSISFGEWSVFARVQVMKDFGLATMSLSGLLLAVFIGVAMLGKEITTKTVYMMASKPISRWSIVIGKYTGLCLTLLINLLLMSLFFFGTIYFIGGAIDLRLSYALLLTMVEMAVIVAVALFFSTVSSPTLSALFTLGFYISGHFNDLVGIDKLNNSHALLKYLLKILYYVIPNLEHFNIRTPIVYDLPLSGGYIIDAVIYGTLYVALLLLLSCLSFSQKDL
jgi:ABC-type transport system involved in multi-copper enzyme maturation permease subunit